MKKKRTEAKILVLDIETAPTMSYHWGLFDQNIGINQIVHDSYVLCWAAKWLGDKNIMSDAIINYKEHFKQNPRSDAKIAETIWKLLDEADIVVTHNGDSFDIKWLNTIFIKNNMAPVSDFRSIDTYKQVKKAFRFTSNKLDYLSRTLCEDHKLHHEGFDLWIKSMAGNETAFRRMIKYCQKDVQILEDLYLEIRPFIKNHPNLNLYNPSAAHANNIACPACESNKTQKRGLSIASTRKYQRYQCQSCGHWFKDPKCLKELETANVRK